jgi:uncharacterized membrane protein required for colicin V production
MSRMTIPDPHEIEARRKRSERMLPSLIISILGAIGIAGLYFLSGGLRFIDIEMLMVIVAFCIVGYGRGVNRGIVTLVIQYIATGVSATIYAPLTPYVMFVPQAWRFIKLAFIATAIDKRLAIPDVGTFFSVQIDNSHIAFSFILFMLIPWLLLEILSRVLLQDIQQPTLGILDNLGGALVHLVIGVIFASLLFNAMGYGDGRAAHNAAWLRPAFNTVLNLYYTAHSFWFRRPPPIYVYDL